MIFSLMLLLFIYMKVQRDSGADIQRVNDDKKTQGVGHLSPCVFDGTSPFCL
ncbi:hypothetical protein XSR1_120044 [Xenorhabdus szentirmaii DSM 16338]|uniref:Uncharacterized protein n=1 Tax=Xenorhabdus szentirmaii DSM 16338 TaxID=1427518 RepID=W1ISA1_9GAMM|nr:hypothetical protein XSR1_120044 [Xenorhabdus szentirmaii DSM 16338]